MSTVINEPMIGFELGVAQQVNFGLCVPSEGKVYRLLPADALHIRSASLPLLTAREMHLAAYPVKTTPDVGSYAEN